MSFEITKLIENEDGSADVEFDVSKTDAEELQMLVEEGLNFLMIKTAYGLTTNQICDLLEASKASNT